MAVSADGPNPDDKEPQAPAAEEPDEQFTDPDDLALADALREAEAEEKGEGAPKEPEQPTPTANAPAGTPPAGSSPEVQSGPAAPAPGPMIPKDRFDQMCRRAYAAESHIQNLQGRLDVYQTIGKGGQAEEGQNPSAPETQEASPQDRIAAARQKVLDAAEQFDRGEITLAQAKRIELETDGEIETIRAEMTKKVEQAESAGAGQSQPGSWVEEREAAAETQRLEQQHPYLRAMGDQHVQTLVATAYAQAAAEGRPIGPDPTGHGRETMRLRAMVAQLSDIYGPHWFPNAQVQTPTQTAAHGGNPPDPSNPSNPQDPAVLAKARASKMEQAERMPPDINAMGKGAGSPAMTDEDIANLSEAEFDALPAATRERALHGRDELR